MKKVFIQPDCKAIIIEACGISMASPQGFVQDNAAAQAIDGFATGTSIMDASGTSSDGGSVSLIW